LQITPWYFINKKVIQIDGVEKISRDGHQMDKRMVVEGTRNDLTDQIFDPRITESDFKELVYKVLPLKKIFQHFWYSF
jgi:hypothetical protein